MSTPRSENKPASNPPPATAAGKNPSGFRPQPHPGTPWLSLPPGWGRVLCALAAIHLAQPLFWGPPRVPLWSPTAGLGLVLVAWFGWRFGAGILATSGLLVLVQTVARTSFSGGVSLLDLSWILVETTLLPLEAVAAWWLYHSLARGSLRLGDPRSAMLFVLLVPGVIAVLSGLLHLGFASLIEAPDLGPGGPFRHLISFWLARALGMVVLAPPLFVLLTPWLHRRGWLRPDTTISRRPMEAGLLVPFTDSPALEQESGTGSVLMDWIEIGLLALATSAACVFLSRLHGPGELLGWQLWGIPGLLIVWAALRQGLRGGILVASVAAGVLLLARWLGLVPSTDPLFQPLMQGHLVAQCSAALLVSAGSSWVRRREASYRQVISQVPVVIYSARLLRMPRGSDPPRGTELAGSQGDSKTPRPPVVPRGEIGVGVAEITLVSNASSKLLDVPGALLLGDYTRWLACIHFEDREVVLAALEQLARQDQPVACEYRLASSVGPASSRRPPSAGGSPAGEVVVARNSTRWLRDTLAPRRNHDGRLVGWEGVVTDITEQRALADDLRRTTNMFHALIGNLPTGVFFVQGPHGLPILVNARARQLLGQREDSAAGLEHLPQVYRLFRADGTLYPAEELPVYMALVEGRTTMRDDIFVHRPDGRRVPLVTWAAPVNLGGRGAPNAAVWVLEDLTALHQAEAARKDTEGQLRAIIETMAEGMLVHDGQGRILSSNPAASAFFGMPAEKMCGQTLADLSWVFFHEKGDPLAPDEHPAQIALRTSRPVRHVLLGVQSPGMSDSGSGSCLLSRWILVNAMPLGMATEKADLAGRLPGTSETRGQPAGVVTTFSDITAYVHARETIRASEERYRGLIESLPLMLIQCDRTQRVIYINPATTALTGYTLGEIADPTAWANLIFPDDLAIAYRLSRSAMAGQIDKGEIRYRAKDGSEKETYTISQPRYQDGVIIGTTSLFVDVTRERRLERELQRAQRLELIGRLSSGVAHDFNNLLGVVLSLTDLARGQLPPDHPALADLHRISEASEQAAGLAAQLLALSKQRPTPVRRVDVNHVSRRTLGLLQATLPSSITLLADLAPGELPILADETQVQQVVMNLCLNARDAMPDGGSLRVQTFLREGRVYLVVADSGTGMSEEVRRQVFEPFFSTKEYGTGLGLAVVQQVVESHGGKVVLTSRPGEGATFEVTWPAME
jgi:PAS domain S-box-containing protein